MSRMVKFSQSRKDWRLLLDMQVRMEHAKEQGVIIGFTSKVNEIDNTVEFEVEYPNDNPDTGTTSYRGVDIPQPVVPSPRPVPPGQESD